MLYLLIGRNGYGAKLTNIFSKKFIVETANSKKKKLEFNLVCYIINIVIFKDL